MGSIVPYLLCKRCLYWQYTDFGSIIFGIFVTISVILITGPKKRYGEASIYISNTFCYVTMGVSCPHHPRRASPWSFLANRLAQANSFTSLFSRRSSRVGLARQLISSTSLAISTRLSWRVATSPLPSASVRLGRPSSSRLISSPLLSTLSPSPQPPQANTLMSSISRRLESRNPTRP